MDLDLFDLVVFKSNNIIGSMITITQDFLFPKINESWTHCGLIITHSVLDLLNIKYNKNEVYIIESTISGTLFDNIYDINNNSKNGVQIRSLNELLKYYKKTGLYKLKNKIVLTPELSIIIKNYYLKIKESHYNNNITTIIKNLTPVLLHKFLMNNDDNSFFCSQLCIEIYKELNIISKETNSELFPPNLFINKFKYLFENLVYLKLMYN